MPHVPSDRCIHWLARTPPPVVGRTPAGRVRPTLAIVLFAAHSFSVLPEASVAWGVSPSGVLTGQSRGIRAPLSGENQPEQCKMQMASTSNQTACPPVRFARIRTSPATSPSASQCPVPVRLSVRNPVRTADISRYWRCPVVSCADLGR